jgi:signal recognition particle GTPase
MEHKLTVMMAACDTFRSGAVEQLKEHGRRLGVEVFDRGYSKHPADVAAAAVKHAHNTGVNVVLIDTAGAQPASHQTACVCMCFGVCVPWPERHIALGPLNA